MAIIPFLFLQDIIVGPSIQIKGQETTTEQLPFQKHLQTVAEVCILYSQVLKNGRLVDLQLFFILFPHRNLVFFVTFFVRFKEFLYSLEFGFPNCVLEL